MVCRETAIVIGRAQGIGRACVEEFIRLFDETFSIEDVRKAEVSVKVEGSENKLGALQNSVVLCHDAPPWKFGITALMSNLAKRGLL